jgi:hypothetical protein
MNGHLLDRLTFGAVGSITPLVDSWIDPGRLPDFMRPAPRQSS